MPKLHPSLLLLLATVNGCGGDNDGRFQIGRVATAELYANGILVVADGTIAVSSGSLSIGEDGSRAELRLINTGASDLEITEVTLESEPPGVFRLARDSTSLASLSSGPYTIAPQNAPGGQLLLTAYVVVMRPARGVAPVGTLKIASNSFTGGVAQPTITYHLRLDIAPPSILVVPTAIDFGTVLPGQSAQDSVSVLNQGGDALVIDRIWLRGHDGFEVAVGPNTFQVSPESSANGITLDPPLEIAPGATAPLRLQYRATGPDRAIGNLVLSSNDPAAVDGTTVSLLANAGAPTAPVVAIDAPEGANGTITCKLITEAVHSEPLTYAWYWQVGDAASFTTFGPTLGADEVEDCDRVRCWTEVTDSHVTISSNVSETALPVGADCDDQNPCTDEACGVTEGCVHAPNTAPCEDSDLCTGGDVCADGQCQAGPPVDCSGVTASCIHGTCNPATGKCDLPEPDETPCDDGDLCNGAETCHAGECIAGPAIDCSTVTNPCVAEACNPATGACDLAKADDTSCTDGSPCNGVETCHSGVCQPGFAVDCSALTNPCIQGTCNPISGACDLPMPDSTPCHNADLCDGTETCQSGICRPGIPPDCSLSLAPCVEDACNPATGRCDLPMDNGVPCTDPNICGSVGICDAGQCSPDNDSSSCVDPACAGASCEGQTWFSRTLHDPDGTTSYTSNRAAELSTGEHLLTGAILSVGHLRPGIFVTKLDQDGELLWHNTYVYPGLRPEAFSAIGYDATESTVGTYLVVGSVTLGSDYPTGWILALATDGSILWQKAYDGLRDATRVAQDSDGGFIVSGTSTSNSLALMKIDAGGDIVWHKTYADTKPLWGLTVVPGDGYLMTGRTRSGGTSPTSTPSYGWVLRIAPSGDIRWQRVFDTYIFEQSYLLSSTLAQDGGFLVTGGISNGLLLAEISDSGALEWQRTYGSGNGWAISRLRNGGYLLSASTLTFPDSRSLPLVLRLTDDFSVEWARTYGAPDMASQFIIAPSGLGLWIASSRPEWAASRGMWVLHPFQDGSVPGTCPEGLSSQLVQIDPVDREGSLSSSTNIVATTETNGHTDTTAVVEPLYAPMETSCECSDALCRSE